jgi:hypothetical protein
VRVFTVEVPAEAVQYAAEHGECQVNLIEPFGQLITSVNIKKSNVETT